MASCFFTRSRSSEKSKREFRSLFDELIELFKWEFVLNSVSSTWFDASLRSTLRFLTTNRTIVAFSNWILLLFVEAFSEGNGGFPWRRSSLASDKKPLLLAKSAAVNWERLRTVTGHLPCLIKIVHAPCWPFSAA